MNGKKARALRKLNPWIKAEPGLATESTRDGMSDWDREKRKANALGRLRRSGLFEMDMASWIRYFDENPDYANPDFVGFVISRRKSELRRWF